jgi:hypothetical protein
MVLPLLVFLLLPSQHSAEFSNQLTCDPAAGGDWQPECDLLDTSAIFAAGDNETARFERGEILPFFF